MKLEKFKNVYSNNNSIAFFETNVYNFQGYNENSNSNCYFVNDTVVGYYKSNNKKYCV